MGKYDESGVYSVNISNTEKAIQISKIHPTKIYLYKDFLYVISQFGSINGKENEDYGTWRMDKKGNNVVSIFDFCPKYMIFFEDSIYYTNEENVICSMELGGSNETIYEGAETISGLNVSENYIFYIDKETYTIYRMNKDGSNKKELNINKSGALSIVEDWIFYQNQDDKYKIYKMSFDGDYNEPIY